jgi:ABC-2 type transport system permease protein
MARSRFFRIFFLVCLIFPVFCALFVYLYHNLSALELLGLKPSNLMKIESQFFLNYLGFQSMLAFFVAAFVGPGLVAPDLANNALPLYLSRPFSRTEYILGKLTVLVALLSAMTWIPGLLLYLLQGYLAGGTWMGDHTRIAAALVAGSLVWILLLSLLALALSAWVKWRPVAGGLMFGVFFVAAGMGVVSNRVLRIRWGHLLNISHLMGSVWVDMFEEPMRRGAGAAFFRVARGEEIPVWMCWAVLSAMCAACLWLLAHRVKGVEVVR